LPAHSGDRLEQPGGLPDDCRRCGPGTVDAEHAAVVTDEFGDRDGLRSREDEDAAEAAGVNTLKYKLTAFLISTFFAGLAGGVFAYYSTAVQAGYMFSALWTFDAVIIVFVGGVGTIIGPIIGAVFFVLLKQLLSLYLPGGSHIMVFGILFILVVLFLPGGLIGTIQRFRKKRPGGVM